MTALTTTWKACPSRQIDELAAQLLEHLHGGRVALTPFDADLEIRQPRFVQGLDENPGSGDTRW